MSDTGRKDLSDSLKETVKPDSQKGYMEKLGENVSSALDKGASLLQPESEKSTTQKVADGVKADYKNAASSAQDTKDNQKQNPDSLLNKASNIAGQTAEAVGSYAESAKEYVGELLSGTSTTGTTSTSTTAGTPATTDKTGLTGKTSTTDTTGVTHNTGSGKV